MTPRTPVLLLHLLLSQRRGAAGKEVISVLRSSSALSEDILLLPTLQIPRIVLFFFPTPPPPRLRLSNWIRPFLRVFSFFLLILRARVYVQNYASSLESRSTVIFLGSNFHQRSFYVELFTLLHTFTRSTLDVYRKPGLFGANRRVSLIRNGKFFFFFFFHSSAAVTMESECLRI